MTKQIAPYGAWRSPIDLLALFERPSSPVYPAYYQGRLYWLEARAKEGGRLVLMRREPDGRNLCLTPEGFNVRTRVHEYGGRCFVFGNDAVYFSDFSDQRIYVQPLVPDAVPKPVTPATDVEGNQLLYADFQLTPCGKYLICVCECEHQDRENTNYLAAVALGSAHAESSAPQRLVGGCDFYANPVLSPNGSRLAWIQWNHPNMPWDETQLMVADVMVGVGLTVSNPTAVALASPSAVCQLCFLDNDCLMFAADFDSDEVNSSNFWNLHTLRDNRVEAVTADLAEYGYPHWVFGETRYAPMDADTILASRTGARGDELVQVDLATKSVEPVATAYNRFSQFAYAHEPDATDTGAWLIASSSVSAPALVRYYRDTNTLETVEQPAAILDESDISCPEPIVYPTRDGMHAHAYFYPPRNSAFEAAPDSRPPLLVMVHGGPTSRAHPTLDPARQYWTTSGYAVLDVNHRGSTGYGRHYRQLLRGHWGEYDAIDAVDGIEYLKSEDRIDPTRVCIRGRSAGGYAVLRALTYFPEYFNAGACYFGIGNLATLAESTHKFEYHYTDVLIGERFNPSNAVQPSSIYFERSPIHFIDRVRSPMILFQGAEDKVVPPEVSREMARVLKEHDVPHEYVEYPGEGHGFRRAETNIDALTRETAFFSEALGIDRI
ncbi:MAG: prolyl oligopeptidase family serine peptidase [Gammaproteobacteria bacterium]|nr:prolyl oligopeptidase family serine peptidase [Gammaproteobacteria bacterium]